mgnify:CR=1 FL=1
MMFGTILTSGIQMIAKAGFTQRNITIAALSLSIGIGFTTASEIGIWHIFPEILQSVFSANVVAVVFIISIVLAVSCLKTWTLKRSRNRDVKMFKILIAEDDLELRQLFRHVLLKNG